jgi:hypothetical protein
MREMRAAIANDAFAAFAAGVVREEIACPA